MDLFGAAANIIKALLFESSQAIRCHVDEYKSSKKLKPEGGGTEEKLSTEQSEQLETHLQEQTYLYVKDITAYVEVTFGITYTVPGMRGWLQRHGFSYKKKSAWIQRMRCIPKHLAIDSASFGFVFPENNL